MAFASTNDPTAPDTQRLTKAVFHGREALGRGVRRLFEKSVPADTIRVFMLDETGRRTREIDVADEAGAVHGAKIGAAVGAGIGVLMLVLLAVGVLVDATAEIGTRDVIANSWIVLAGAVSGVPLGALLGMGNWQGHKRIPRREFRRGAAEVEVEGAGLGEVAADALRAAGAVSVTRE